MATTKTPTKKSKTIGKDDILSAYMNEVLETGQEPNSVFKFCKEQNIKEAEFYEQFSSFEHLKSRVWSTFHDHTLRLMEQQGRGEMTPKEQLLTYFFTYFEMLTANRSYCLLVLDREQMMRSGSLTAFRELRTRMKEFTQELIQQGNAQKTAKFLQHPENIFSEGVWFQFLFLLRYWIKDTSAGFEKTDIAIEKSVQTAFDLFETAPLESLIDFGKFLWKEAKM
jgi:AcrR family transcriptional regulator